MTNLTTGSRLIHGDCIRAMTLLPTASVDFVLTDPPYGISYKDRNGRTMANDDSTAWIEPAFTEIARVLKPGRFCLSFYGWYSADIFVKVWKAHGLRPQGHFSFVKEYASSRRIVQRRHEVAYLLSKGSPADPERIVSDVQRHLYTGNELHPTQKSVESVLPIVEAFTKPGEIVLDPFMGSGSLLVAALRLNRRIVGIELSRAHYVTAHRRILKVVEAMKAHAA